METLMTILIMLCGGFFLIFSGIMSLLALTILKDYSKKGPLTKEEWQMGMKER